MLDGGSSFFSFLSPFVKKLEIWYREYIVDLMADPGTLIPSDVAGAHMDYDESFLSSCPVSTGPSHLASSSGGTTSSSEDTSEFTTVEQSSKLRESIPIKKDEEHLLPIKAQGAPEVSSRPNHARSPSWTEGVSNPAVRKMKVKDVSKYMMKAAKENPQLAQKLHDVLLESGVVAPPNLFTEMYPEQLEMPLSDVKPPLDEKEKRGSDDKLKKKGINNLDRSFLPPLPHSVFHPRGNVDEHLSSDSEASPVKYKQNVPVAAAAAAAAAVVASSMVVAVAKTSSGPKLQLPVAAAATATAAAVVATTAAVTKQYEVLDSATHSPDSLLSENAVVYERGSGEHRENEGMGASSEGERISDRSTENESTRSDSPLDDVADCEIPWEDITLGERIGLGTNPAL